MKSANHKDRKHAKLSASGASRWLRCPGSIKACEGIEDTSSPYALEGTLAHEVADLCLSNNHDAEQYIDKTLCDDKGNQLGKVDSEMVKSVQEYVDYVLSFEKIDTLRLTEERVYYDHIVPGGFGTTDSAIVDFDEKTCHIFDLKYGKGVKVNAYQNNQAMIYAIGMINELSFFADIETFVLHIVQPRLNHFDSWEVSKKDIDEFAVYVSERAKIALSDNAPLVPGKEQCRWCKVTCKALMDFSEETTKVKFENLDKSKLDVNKLTDTDKKNIIDNRSLIESFLKSVEKSVYERVLSGETFEGYKLVEGRSIRRWADNAESVLVDNIGDDAYDKKLIGITAAEKAVGKSIVSEITIKPTGKPTMVKESDNRKTMVLAESDFDNLDA